MTIEFEDEDEHKLSEYERSLTFGPWTDERESVNALDEVLENCGLFRIYKEVPGYYLQPKPTRHLTSPRIDRVLSPAQLLVESGWSHGLIGIEGKASGVKSGPALSQMLDYSRAIWCLPYGYRVWLNWIFLWPLRKQHLTIASIMAQNCIGSAYPQRWRPLNLMSGEQAILRVHSTGEFDIGAGQNGQRIGSRSVQRVN